MDKKLQFNEALTSIVELASAQGNTLSPEDIHSAFEGIIEEDSMYEYIFKYLADSKISVTGFINTDHDTKEDNSTVSKDDALEKSYVDMYMKDINSIPAVDDKDLDNLLIELLNGSENAVSSLIENHLLTVTNIAKDFLNKGVSFADLIQEGNLGLMEGTRLYKGDCSIDSYRKHIDKYIRNAMENAIAEQNGSDRIGQHIADRANSLDHASSELAKKLNREPTLKELADYVSLTEDEVKNIMKISLDALTIEGEGAVS